MAEWEDDAVHVHVPSIGDRVELLRGGVALRGRVCYADHLQVLVKRDDGRSASLRIGRDRFRILETTSTE